MTAFWITLNFIFVLLAYYLILHLYQRIKILQQGGSDPNGYDVDQLMDRHIENIRKENTRLISEIRRLIQEQEELKFGQNVSSGQQDSASSENQEADKIREKPRKQTFSNMLDQATQHFKTSEAGDRSLPEKQTKTQNSPSPDEWVPPIDDIEDTVEESPYVQAIKLQEKGYSVTEIAKELNRGKGEVELLLKLRGKAQS